MNQSTALEGEVQKIYVTAAVKANLEFDYGMLIPKAWLIKNFGLVVIENGSRKQFEAFNLDYMNNLNGFKAIFLEEFKKCLECVVGKGYRIVTPAEQTAFALKQVRKKGRKEILRAHSRLVNIDTSKLTYEQKRARDEGLSKIAALNSYQEKRLRVEEHLRRLGFD